MSRSTLFGFILIFISLGLLIPGLMKPVLTLVVKVEFLGLTTEIVHEHRSILETIRHLYETGNNLITLLILLFAIVVPVTKAILLLTTILVDKFKRKYELYRIIDFISKWAMADVFMVAIFATFLIGQATISLSAELNEGFYYFLGYCLTSNASLHFIKLDKKNAERAAKMAAP